MRTVYLEIFRVGHSAIFSLVQAYWGALKYIETYSEIIEAFSAIWSDIFRILCNPGIYNPFIFKILAYVEADPFSNVC